MPVLTPSLSEDVFDYLCVERFLADAISVRFLKCAIDLGLIEALDGGGAEEDSARRAAGLDPSAFALLTSRLAADEVIERQGAAMRLSPEFARAWRHRDLIENKIEFADLMAPDFFDGFANLLREPNRFQEESYLFSLFDYGRCLDAGPDGRLAARRWTRYTTALTSREAEVCLSLHDVSRHRRMLDVGGNTGEFALRACRRNPGLEATVADLPAVCEVGREHIADRPEADRIRFLPGDWSARRPPGRYDLVCFKSMLHDWPAAEAERFLESAHEVLEPGGTVLIFERTAPRRAYRPGYGSLPILLFFRSYREPGEYLDMLRRIGFVAADHLEVELDSTFTLLVAEKRE